MAGIGDTAPNFTGQDFINNVAFDLSGHAGKVIVLSFVAKWCGPCNTEVPRLQNLWAKFSGHGIQVVAVHVGGGTEAQAQAWMTGLGVTFPAIQDNASLTLANLYGVSGIPRTFIIGRDMVIRKDILGLETESVIEGHLMDVVHMRDPIDVEMVMDVSDSMNSPSGDTKLDMMKQAMKMGIDFLKDHGQGNDRMGLVWFTDDASEYQNASGQKLLPVPTNWSDLKAQIDAHGTGTCTAMGAGLQRAFDTLSSIGTQKRFAILCTDGMQNIEPKVTKVGSHYEIIDSGGWLCGGHSSVPPHPGVDITSYNARVHTIGVGITGTYANLLQEISNVTDGFYKGTNDPIIDLDLIYFTDLCNCMAGGSPAVIHHNTGNFYPEECKAEEIFYLNRSIRKITAIISWKKSQGSKLNFWLYSPDGTLLDLHHEMKQFENYCLATIYLPRHQDGNELKYVGQWKMVIRGETPGSCADYHAFVIGEDLEIKYLLDFPRKYYEVGDILPIRVKLKEFKEPILEPIGIIMEMASPRVQLAELLAQFKVSSYELRQKMKVGTGKYQHDPLLLKIEAMASDPRFSKLLKPVRNKLSLQEGSLECKISEEEITIPVTLTKPGLYSFKVSVHCETLESGPIYRTDMVTVNVGPGKFEPKQTSVNFMRISTKKLKGGLIFVTPRNEKGQLLGPGLGREFKAVMEKKDLKIKVDDQLDGNYQIELLPTVKRTKVKEKRAHVNIMFQGRSVWKGII